MDRPSSLTLEGKGRSYEGSWCLIGETLEWRIDGKIYRLESGGDLSAIVRRFVKTLEDRVLKEKLRLRACLTCENFSMSSMARDMGRGQRGVCNFHQMGVEICYICPDYRRGEM